MLEEMKQIQRLLLELVRLETMANHMVAESLDALKVKTTEVLTGAVDVQAHGEVSSAEVKASAPVEPLPDLIDDCNQVWHVLYDLQRQVGRLRGELEARRDVVNAVIRLGAEPAQVSRLAGFEPQRSAAVRQLLSQVRDIARRAPDVLGFEAP